MPGSPDQRKQPLQDGLDTRPISRGQETRTPRESLLHRLRFIHSYPARRIESGMSPIGHLNIVLTSGTSGRCWNDHNVRISSVKEHDDRTRLRPRATRKRIIDDDNLTGAIGRHALFSLLAWRIPLGVSIREFFGTYGGPLRVLVAAFGDRRIAAPQPRPQEQQHSGPCPQPPQEIATSRRRTLGSRHRLVQYTIRLGSRRRCLFRVTLPPPIAPSWSGSRRCRRKRSRRAQLPAAAGHDDGEDGGKGGGRAALTLPPVARQSLDRAGGAG